MFLDEMLLEFPDPKSVPRSTSFEPTAKQENTVVYLQQRHNEQRHRLLLRHTAEYEKWVHENDMCIDGESFQLDYSAVIPTPGMCAESFDFINAPAAKEALARLPSHRRNVLISAEQLKVPTSGPQEPPEPRSREVTAAEFAAIMGMMGVNERRRMLNEEEEMRMFHFESMELFYSAMMRTDPAKYPKTGQQQEPGKQQLGNFGIGGPGAPAQQPLHNPVSFSMKPPAATQGTGGTVHKGPPKNPPLVARDPRLDPPRDPRLDRR
ncbi:hypothetical protein K440DRAFT_325510 [Wilcoxina mikolae CBS 423.85]|nr:hypothetical protein K440DRAFT_325510 [Wilcoxina mikolae CBS 423.85]